MAAGGDDQPAGGPSAAEGVTSGDEATTPSKEMSLRLEAQSIAHMLTHKPKNGFRAICDRAKTKQVPHMRGAFSRPLTKWGDIITADHIDSQRATMMGLNGEREALVIKDVWSGYKWVYTSRYEDALDVTASVRDFVHGRKVSVMYTDGMPACPHLVKYAGMRDSFQRLVNLACHRIIAL